MILQDHHSMVLNMCTFLPWFLVGSDIKGQGISPMRKSGKSMAQIPKCGRCPVVAESAGQMWHHLYIFCKDVQIVSDF